MIIQGSKEKRENEKMERKVFRRGLAKGR